MFSFYKDRFFAMIDAHRCSEQIHCASRKRLFSGLMTLFEKPMLAREMQENQKLNSSKFPANYLIDVKRDELRN
jgi:hypothetical protein